MAKRHSCKVEVERERKDAFLRGAVFCFVTVFLGSLLVYGLTRVFDYKNEIDEGLSKSINQGKYLERGLDTANRKIIFLQSRLCKITTKSPDDYGRCITIGDPF